MVIYMKGSISIIFQMARENVLMVMYIMGSGMQENPMAKVHSKLQMEMKSMKVIG